MTRAMNTDPPMTVAVSFDAHHIEVTDVTFEGNSNNSISIGTSKRYHSSSDEDDCESVPTLIIEEDFCIELKRKKTKKSYPSDLIVVLDLDDCLIHSKEIVKPKPSCHKEKDDGGSLDPTKHAQSTFELKVLLRPGLVDFLVFVTSQYQTHIFTAGSKRYADPIIDRLCMLVGDSNAFAKRWYRNDCETIAFDLGHGRIYVKPLAKVAEWAGRNDLGRIVHVDDRLNNFLLNHDNGIPILSWQGDPDDKYLQIVKPTLQNLDQLGDVRPYLRKIFSESYSELESTKRMMDIIPFTMTEGIDRCL
ncbi:MAG: TFIIF-interacting CTD phosphatase-like protein [Bacillariaceae sp.]|jgi:TFIIF-interacting CTD phosphatase-like protein